MRQLTHQERKQVTDFIKEHFNMMEFQTFLLETTEFDLFSIMPPAIGFDLAIPQIIDQFNKNYNLHILLLALDSRFPQFSLFRRLLHDMNISYGMYDSAPSNLLDGNALQNMVNNEEWLEAELFYDGFGRSKRCVCKVIVEEGNGSVSYGTGFLVGPSHIMTNYHVVGKVIQNMDLLKKTKFLFDYEQLGDNTIYKGTEYSIASDDCLVAHSEPCIHDINGNPDINEECDDPLFDYVILRADTDIGNHSFGLKNASNDQPRGWINLVKPSEDSNFQSRSLIILQHPEGRSMKLAIGLKKVIAKSPNNKRVRYEINTLRGSSGSPVFTTKFELIALHNMGDPRYVPEFNQGVIMERILEDLNTKQYTIELCPLS